MNVVSLVSPGKLLSRPKTAELARAWAESWADEPVVHLTLTDLPNGLSESMAAEMRWLEAANQPAPDALIFGELARAADALCRELPDNEQVLADWLEAYRKMPSDLFMLAVKRARSEWLGAKFPNPGELRHLIAEELCERREDLARIQTAALKIGTIQARAESDARTERCRQAQASRRAAEWAALKAAAARMDAPAS